MDFPSADSYGTPRQNPTTTSTTPHSVPEVEVLEAESTKNNDNSTLLHFFVGALVGAFVAVILPSSSLDIHVGAIFGAFAAIFFGAMRR